MKKNNLFLYMPMILIVLYIIISFLFFLTGTITWTTPNKGLTSVFMLFICISFSAGYYFVAKRRINKPVVPVFTDKISIIRKTIFILAIVGIVYYIGYIINMFGEYALVIFKYPGAIYDYKTYVNLHLATVGPFEKSIPYTIIAAIHALFTGFITMTIPVGLYFWKALKLHEKISVILLIVAYILKSYYTGLQSLFLLLCIMLLAVVLAKSYLSIKNNTLSKRKVYMRFAVATIALLCFFASIMYTFLRDRDAQRDLQIAHSDAYEAITGYKPGRLSLIGEAINDRIDGKFAEYNLSDSKDGYESSFTIVEEREVLQVYGLASFYELDIYNSPIYKASPSAYYAVQSIEMYFSQGYAALGLAFEQDFEWTYFVGSSRYFTEIADSIFDSDIYTRTYLYKNEETFGWDGITYWATLYSWLASDFTFYGIIVLFGLFGMLLAMTWVDIISLKNPFALALFCIMFMGFLMTTANNFLFADRTMTILTTELFGAYIFSLFCQKKHRKKLK